MNKSDRHVKGLWEVSIGVRDLDVMHKFYEEVIGLEVLKREESFVFFKIAEGLGLKVNATVHEWLHVRSLYFSDPEWNLLEFGCYDASVG